MVLIVSFLLVISQVSHLCILGHRWRLIFINFHPVPLSPDAIESDALGKLGPYVRLTAVDGSEFISAGRPHVAYARLRTHNNNKPGKKQNKSYFVTIFLMHQKTWPLEPTLFFYNKGKGHGHNKILRGVLTTGGGDDRAYGLHTVNHPRQQQRV